MCTLIFFTLPHHILRLASIFKLTTSKNMKFHEARYASLRRRIFFFAWQADNFSPFSMQCNARRNLSLMHLTW